MIKMLRWDVKKVFHDEKQNGAKWQRAVDYLFEKHDERDGPVIHKLQTARGKEVALAMRLRRNK
jgi:hypothetical protein